MLFEINFNQTYHDNNRFLIDKLGAKLVPTGSTKYPPFEIMEIEIKDFEHLKEILDLVDKEFGGFSDAIISYDPPTVFLDVDDIYLKIK